MNDENRAKFNAMVTRINAMPNNELEGLIAFDLCPFEPEHMKEVPLGMFRCPCCIDMVVAGLPHPRWYFLTSEGQVLQYANSLPPVDSAIPDLPSDKSHVEPQP